MSSGMDAVVHGASVVMEGETRRVVLPQGGAHATVGEAVVLAHPRIQDGLFAYSTQNRATAPIVSDPGQGAARGGFTYSMMAPEEPGVGAIGIYFYERHLGVLYAPLLVEAPERYPGVSQAQFVKLVRLRHGITLHG
jgi:hypothetical protein